MLDRTLTFFDVNNVRRYSNRMRIRQRERSVWKASEDILLLADPVMLRFSKFPTQREGKRDKIKKIEEIFPSHITAEYTHQLHPSPPSHLHLPMLVIPICHHASHIQKPIQ